MLRKGVMYMSAEKASAYRDAVAIVQAAYGSETAYKMECAPQMLEDVYKKLCELAKDACDD